MMINALTLTRSGDPTSHERKWLSGRSAQRNKPLLPIPIITSQTFSPPPTFYNSTSIQHLTRWISHVTSIQIHTLAMGVLN